MKYCVYYQAHIKKESTWFFTAILRSFEHLTFDRTLDKHREIFEFFVPQDLEHYFLEVMHFFQEQGIAKELLKLPNRLLSPDELL